MLKFMWDTGTPRAGELGTRPVHGEVDGVKLSCPIQIPIHIDSHLHFMERISKASHLAKSS